MGTTVLAATDRLSAHSLDEVVDAVKSAHHSRTSLRVAGRGAWLRAGHTVRASRVLDVSGLRGIVEYVPGDLTLTAGAGTTLADIARATAPHGQWLPLDPFGSRDGTLGATLATASAGPLAHSIGVPRDVTLGLTWVSGTGEIVRAGGRVVKNVAGFDLVRLTIGAWGTLGVITEVTVRLRARPEVDETVALTLPPERDALATLLSSIRVAAVEPLAAELLSPVCAARIGLGERSVMLVRLAGNATSVHHQQATLSRLTPCEPVSIDVWRALMHSDPATGAVLRISRRPSELSRLWTMTMAVPGVDAHGTLGRGIVRLRDSQVPTGLDQGDTCIFEVPDETTATARTMPNAILSRRLRDAFDPARILNPGIMGDDPA